MNSPFKILDVGLRPDEVDSIFAIAACDAEFRQAIEDITLLWGKAIDFPANKSVAANFYRFVLFMHHKETVH
ncbi:hypothetical protein G6L97_04205 [Agrobacterium tumefaciens]|uniref:hypothetical protein n=1 Tax=Agrobacterium tumefaciens TaxID=358 RepID=UPI0012301A25|nr:hypothetical protein [Agrobacterium tumefaciens]KAA3531410.1 hypothetical protein DXM29_05490 [Agrobacterium tumefaciens]NSZ83615.1 hypothetical protein [Agrobacterium tumefaciens]WCA69822.1 hypothetical protein G6L97_04205 [Agrobacterium tumefaciens]